MFIGIVAVLSSTATLASFVQANQEWLAFPVWLLLLLILVAASINVAQYLVWRDERSLRTALENAERSALAAARMPPEQRARIHRAKETAGRLGMMLAASAPDFSRVEAHIASLREDSEALVEHRDLAVITRLYALCAEVVLRAKSGHLSSDGAAIQDTGLDLWEVLDTLQGVANLTLLQHPETPAAED